jgi:hypothetical protein
MNAPWTQRIENGQKRAKAAAQIIIAKLEDPDVRAALAGQSTRAGHSLDSYLLPAYAGETLPEGRQLLTNIVDGVPVDPRDVNDLLHAVRNALIAYQQQFQQLPKDAPMSANGAQDYFDLVTPEDKTLAHYLRHHAKRSKPELDKRYLSPEQQQTLDTSIGAVIKSTQLILGNEPHLPR